MNPMTVGCGVQPDSTPADIITKMVQEKGRLSQTINQITGLANTFIKVLEPTKEFFPSRTGDVLNELILDIARPQESDVLDWGVVRAASPGYNPCCVEMKEIPYGSRTVSACLYRDNWKSPEFCKVDLSFKYEREKQMRQQTEIMSQWTKDIWSNWSISAYQRSVMCMTLSSTYGLPEALGEYLTSALPTSPITFQHLEEIFRRIKGEGGEMGRTIPQHELIFIGAEEFAFLEEQYMIENERLGARGVDFVLPEIGSVKKLGKYMFVLLDAPRRFGTPAAGQTFEDVLVNSTIRVNSQHGTIDARNPDYYQESTAPYSEAIFFNASAAAWLVPPEAMVNGDSWFPASDYSGMFDLVNLKTAHDPFGENVYFAARFMAGMIARFPKRARAVLSLAVHGRYKDVCVESCEAAGPVEPEKWPVLECCEIMGGDRLQLLLKRDSPLPDNCPDNSSLFIVTINGNKYLIDTVVSQEAYAGDEINTEGGTLVTIELPPELSAAATCRADCDAWDYVACLPANTVSSDPTITGCAGCSPNEFDPDVCTHSIIFDSVDGPITLRDSDDNVLITFVVPPTAANVDASIETWLLANGGGSATVTEVDDHWEITITGNNNALLVGAYVIYDDGLHQSNADVVRVGDCA